MAVQQLMAPLPHIVAAGGFTIKFEAVDPTTGLAVAGVTVKQMAVYGPSAVGDDVAELKAGPFLLVPGPDG